MNGDSDFVHRKRLSISSTNSGKSSPGRGSPPKQGCSVCRARGISCEPGESGQTSCRTCLKAGRTCDGVREESPVLALVAKVSKVSRGQLEEETFDRFVNRFAPWLGKFMDTTFWLKSVLPAAESNESVFNAALAVTALFDMPVDEALPAGSGAQTRYQKAIAWYRESISASMGTVANKKSLPDISLLLLTTIMYMNIEMRQGHYHNLHNLIRMSFSLVYSNKTALWKSKDTVILACLSQLLEATVSLAIDMICVPRSHRDFVIVLAIRIAAETSLPLADQLRLELLSIMYDVNDKAITYEQAQKETCCIIFSIGPCAALSNGTALPKNEDEPPFERNVAQLEDRMRDWYLRFVKYQASLDQTSELWGVLFRQQSQFVQCRGQWQAHYINKTAEGGQKEIIERFMTLLELFEGLVLAKSPNAITDMGIVAPILTVAWYCRDKAVNDRIISIFKLYDIYDKSEFMKNFQAYLDTLLNTPADKATDVERELFGYKPTIFKKWHGYMCVQYLVRKRQPET